MTAQVTDFIYFAYLWNVPSKSLSLYRYVCVFLGGVGVCVCVCGTFLKRRHNVTKVGSNFEEDKHITRFGHFHGCFWPGDLRLSVGDVWNGIALTLSAQSRQHGTSTLNDVDQHCTLTQSRLVFLFQEENNSITFELETLCMLNSSMNHNNLPRPLKSKWINDRYDRTFIHQNKLEKYLCTII